MKVSEAVASRFSVRAYLDKPVSAAQIHRILDRARQAPSGGNLQPWHVYAVAGQPFNQLKTLIRARSAEQTSFPKNRRQVRAGRFQY